MAITFKKKQNSITYTKTENKVLLNPNAVVIYDGGNPDAATNATVAAVSGTLQGMIADISSEVASISAEIVSSIPSVSGFALHSELVSVSGSLYDDIQSVSAALSSAGDVHMSDLVAVSGALSSAINDESIARIASDDGLLAIIQSTSGHGGVTTVNGMSGDVIIAVPEISGLATVAYVDGVSGSLDARLAAVEANPTPDFFAADASAMSGAIVALIPSVTGYATSTEVADISSAIMEEQTSRISGDQELYALIQSMSGNNEPSFGGSYVSGVNGISGDVQIIGNNISVSGTDNVITLDITGYELSNTETNSIATSYSLFAYDNKAYNFDAVNTDYTGTITGNYKESYNSYFTVDYTVENGLHNGKPIYWIYGDVYLMWLTVEELDTLSLRLYLPHIEGMWITTSNQVDLFYSYSCGIIKGFLSLQSAAESISSGTYDFAGIGKVTWADDPIYDCVDGTITTQVTINNSGVVYQDFVKRNGVITDENGYSVNVYDEYNNYDGELTISKSPHNDKAISINYGTKGNAIPVIEFNDDLTVIRKDNFAVSRLLFTQDGTTYDNGLTINGGRIADIYGNQIPFYSDIYLIRDDAILYTDTQIAPLIERISALETLIDCGGAAE